MNSVVISGKLGQNPELSYTPQTQTPCCRLSVAVARDKKEEQPDWLRVTVWGKQAETCNQYLVKGQHVEVRGRIRVNKGKDGKDYTEIVADKVEFGAKPTNYQTAPTQAVTNPATIPPDLPQQVQQTFDDVPFTQINDAPPF